MKKRRILLLCCAGALLTAAVVLAPKVVERVTPWKFAVVGDTRGPDNGVNTGMLNELIPALLQEKPRFVLFTGDLVSGSENYQERLGQLTHWRAVVAQPLVANGIGVYAIRGNHELPAGDPDVPDWDLIFSGDLALPDNGPVWEKKTSYSFTCGNASIIASDVYLKRGRLSRDLSWLGEQLADNRAQHIFVFSHTPAYPLVRGETDGPELSFEQQERDEFARMFAAAGGVAYFCGHDPSYDHSKILVSTGTWFHQIIAGTVTGPVSSWERSYADPGLFDLAHADEYGYVTVDIKGRKGVVTFKKRTGPGKFTPADTFRYTVER